MWGSASCVLLTQTAVFSAGPINAGPTITDLKKLDISEDLKKNTETDIQEMTNAFVKEIDEKYTVKEKEIMTV